MMLTSNKVRIAFILRKFLRLHVTNFSLTLDGLPLGVPDHLHSLQHSSAFLSGSMDGALAEILQRAGSAGLL